MRIQELYKLFTSNPSVQTDTRQLKSGDIFFALRGPSFNGNHFAGQALASGAAYAVVDEDVDTEDERLIRVNDSLATLQQLAAFHRDQFSIPFIAITGSNGKTTTKELMHAVLSSQFKTYTTEGNLNNHIGIPLTILKIRPDAEMAIIEMGANHLHEIASYCMYARPTHGLITNIGKAHLEGFGSAENVAKGKGELFDFLAGTNGVAFVNGDDEKVIATAQRVPKKIFYGSHINESTGELISSDPFLNVKINDDKDFIIKTNLVGVYNLPNVFAAVTIGKYFGISNDKIKSAIENYKPSNSRSQLIQRGNNSIILDAYNANPGSMKAAIENFAAMKGEHKILILGAMKELGEDSLKEHVDIVKLISKFNWKDVLLAGDEFKSVDHPYHQFRNSVEAREWFNEQKFENCLMLVKGSRSMKMETVIG